METKDIIFEMRTKKGLSQEELAEKVFVTRQAVSRWENGETIPNVDTLKLLSQLFDVSINTLLHKPVGFTNAIHIVYGASVKSELAGGSHIKAIECRCDINLVKGDVGVSRVRVGYLILTAGGKITVLDLKDLTVRAKGSQTVIGRPVVHGKSLVVQVKIG